MLASWVTAPSGSPCLQNGLLSSSAPSTLELHSLGPPNSVGAHVDLEEQFSTCGSQPLGRVTYQTSCISAIYVTIHSSSKIYSYEITTKIASWLGAGGSRHHEELY